MSTEKKEKINSEKNIKHGVPALLSFFIPGLGQIIKGNIIKGILFFIGVILSYFLMLLLIGFITLPLIYIWNIYDAYNSN